MRYKVIFTFFLVINCLISKAQSVNPFDIPDRAKNNISESAPIPTIENIIDTTVAISDSISSNTDTLTAIGNIELKNGDNAIEDKAVDSTSISQLNSIVNPFDIRQSSKEIGDTAYVSSSTVAEESPIRYTHAIRDANKGNLIVLLFSLVSLLATAVGIGLDRSKFITMLQSVANTNKLKVLFRDRTGTIDAQFVLLYVIFFLNVSFFLFVAIRDGFLTAYFPPKWLFILLICFGIYATRHFVMWLLTVVFPLGDEVEVFNYSIAIHNIVFASVLVPFIMGLSYAPDTLRPYMFYAATGLAVLIYLFRQVKAMLSAVSSRKIHVIYFFLYLCAVELAPFLVGWRLLHPIG